VTGVQTCALPISLARVGSFTLLVLYGILRVFSTVRFTTGGVGVGSAAAVAVPPDAAGVALAVVSADDAAVGSPKSSLQAPSTNIAEIAAMTEKTRLMISPFVGINHLTALRDRKSVV